MPRSRPKIVSRAQPAVEDFAVVTQLRNHVNHKLIVDAQIFAGDIVAQAKEAADAGIFAIHEIANVSAGDAKLFGSNKNPDSPANDVRQLRITLRAGRDRAALC